MSKLNNKGTYTIEQCLYVALCNSYTPEQLQNKYWREPAESLLLQQAKLYDGKKGEARDSDEYVALVKSAIDKFIRNDGAKSHSSGKLFQAQEETNRSVSNITNTLGDLHW